MFKTIIKLSTLSSILAASISFADNIPTTQINIPVGDGIVQPGKTLAIDLSKIPVNVSYSITCNIKATYDTVMSIQLNGVNTDDFGDIVCAYINADGKDARGLTPFIVYGANAELFPGGNTVFVQSVKFTNGIIGYQPTFAFTNLDQQNAVTIAECHANPANINLTK